LAVPALLSARAAWSTQADLQAAIRAITKGVRPKEDRVKVDAPPLAETGTAVPVTIAVESPMTENDRVVAIHFLLEQNPEPEAAKFALGPRCGKAEVSTRLRMLAPQHVYGLAEMSDGSFWIGSIHVEVTLAACVEIEVR
ncbi:MAG: thiosulfate oxidation carrier protein SoxY, partial [Alphaproteobacteria bacterium]